MKKIILFSMLISIFFPLIMVRAEKWYYKWENVIVDVKLYDSIYNYTDIPKAKLYRDDVLLTDADISYNTTGDWLYYLDDVNTSKPGKYIVYFKAYETKYRPGTCANYKQKIIFNVIDDDKPEIKINESEIMISTEDKALDFTQKFTVSDNSTPTEKIKVKIDDGTMYGKIGLYNVYITAEDESSNVASAVIKVRVVDKDAPKITFLGEANTIYLEVGDIFDITKYLRVLDDNLDITRNYLADLEFLDEKKIVTSKPRNEIYKFTYRDANNNESCIDIKIVVSDTSNPEIILNKSTVETYYLTEFKEEYWQTFVSSVTDRGKDLRDMLLIDTSQIVNKVGNYVVKYYVYDDDGNLGTALLNVILVTYTPPLITTQDVRIKINERVDLFDYVTITDQSDPNVVDSLEINDSSVDYSKAGIYYATVLCHNSSGLYNDSLIKIEIYDDSFSSSIGIRQILLVLIGGLVIIILIYLFIKRKSKKDFSDIDI